MIVSYVDMKVISDFLKIPMKKVGRQKKKKNIDGSVKPHNF